MILISGVNYSCKGWGRRDWDIGLIPVLWMVISNLKGPTLNLQREAGNSK